MKRLAVAVAFAASVGLAGPAAARSISDCVSIKDDDARLACFDAAAGGAGIGTQAEALFGINKVDLEAREGAEELDKVRAKVAAYHMNNVGRWFITLDNGQVWKQTRPARARFDEGGENYAEIERRISGGFLMKVNGTGRAFDVTRVK